MNNEQALDVVNTATELGYTKTEWTTLAETMTEALGTKANPSQMRLFGMVCKQSGLNPFSRQIYAVIRKGKMSIQTGIDGYRSIAERTGKYAGSDDYLYDEGLNEFQMLDKKRSKPITATATVYKMVDKQRCKFSATARWEEYYPGSAQGFMWNKMPFNMLGKCAEAKALRKAFPADLSTLYTSEEMAQADKEPTEGRVDLEDRSDHEPERVQAMDKQAIEHIANVADIPEEPAHAPVGDKISDKQVKILWVWINQSKVPQEVFRGYLLKKWHIDHTTLITKGEMFKEVQKWLWEHKSPNHELVDEQFKEVI